MHARAALGFLRPLVLGAALLALGAAHVHADTYQRTKAGGDFDDPPDPSHGSGYPWSDRTPFGSGGTMPGAGDTAIIGSVDDPLSPTGPDGYTLSGDFSVAILEVGNVTLTGSITATTEMDFGGYGSAVDTLQGGSSSTNNLNGGVNLIGASLTVSGDSDVFVTMTGGSSLNGTTATNLSGTIDGSTATYSGAANVVVAVQNGGKLTTGDGSYGGVTLTGLGAVWTSNGDASASIDAEDGGLAHTQTMSLDHTDSFGQSSGVGVTVDGLASFWNNDSYASMDTVGTDFSVLTVSNGGTATVAGQFTVGGSGANAAANGEIHVQDAQSLLQVNVFTGDNCSVQVTNGGEFTVVSNAFLDASEGASNSFVEGANSLWHVEGSFQVGQSNGAMLYVSDGGLLQVDQQLSLGEASDTQNTIGISSANGLKVTGDTLIGASAQGELDLTGGTGTGNYATLGGSLFIGGGGGLDGLTPANGTVYVSAGAALACTNASGLIQLGVMAGDAGELFVTGTDSTATLPGLTTVGEAGAGLSAATLGAVVTSGSTGVANSKGSTGELDVFDPGTTWTCFELDAGGVDLAGYVGGTGTVAANNYGVLRVTSDFYVSSTASVYVNTAVPANANTTFPYKVAPSDKTHAGGQIYVGTDPNCPDGAIRVGHGGRLDGQAKNLFGNVVVGAGGTFAPGEGQGTFTVTGDCDLSDGGAGGGTTDIQLGGTGGEDKTAGTDYDQLIVTGTATLGGTLTVSLKAGYTPVANDEFRVVHAGAIAGAFAAIVSPGVVLEPKIDDGDLVLTVTEVAIGSPPDITSPAAATATAGQFFSYQIVADNAPYSYGATGLPAGLSINATTGLISGTPTTAGMYQVALAATNSGFEADATLVLTVLAAPPAGSPVITSVLTGSGQLGVAFSYQIAASGTPTSFAVSGLPAGLTFTASTGVIGGTPTVTGTFPVVVSATNAIGTGTATLTLTISPGTVPTITVAATTPVAHLGSHTPGVFTFHDLHAADGQNGHPLHVERQRGQRHGLRAPLRQDQDQARPHHRHRAGHPHRRPRRRWQQERQAGAHPGRHLHPRHGHAAPRSRSSRDRPVRAWSEEPGVFFEQVAVGHPGEIIADRAVQALGVDARGGGLPEPFGRLQVSVEHVRSTGRRRAG